MESGQESQFDYRERWASVAAFLALGVLAIGVGLYRLLVGHAFAPALAGTISAVVLLCVGPFFWGLALSMTVDRLGRRRKITVGEKAITLPRSRLSSSSVTVPLEQITAVRLSRVLDLRLLHLVWPEGRIVVPAPMLASAKHFDGLVRLLADRLEESRVSVHLTQEAEDARRFRPQFSLAWLLLVVTLVAVVLGMHAYVYGGYSWDTPFDVGVALALASGLWLASAGPLPARVFVLGFLLGVWLELGCVYFWFALDWVTFSAGSPTPENWYPLTFALWQLAERLPQAVWVLEGPRASLLGGVVSGVACGGGAVIVWCMAGRARRRAHQGRERV